MASPLLAYANARIRVNTATTVVRDANGRLSVADDAYYLIICYLKRAQYTGVTSGSRKIPLASELYGEMLPGASGDEFYYRGYALQYVSISDTYEWQTAALTDQSMTDITANQSYLQPMKEVDLFFGDTEMRAIVQRSTGVFGGEGIDKIIYPSIGVQIQLTGAEILN